MTLSSDRIFLGCVAGAISVLVFQQTALQLFFWFGLVSQAAFRVADAPPFNAPMVVSVTFWGAIYGGVFGMLARRMPQPFLIKALVATIFAALMSWFVVRPFAGHSVAFGWQATSMLRSTGACWLWGIGITLILPLLHPRASYGSLASLGSPPPWNLTQDRPGASLGILRAGKTHRLHRTTRQIGALRGPPQVWGCEGQSRIFASFV